MVSLSALWLPIVVSALLVFFASALAWTALPHHRKDFARLADEDGLRAELNRQGWQGGAFAFPFAADNQTRKDPEFQKKMQAGPSGLLLLWPKGGATMGKSLATYFVQCLVLSFLIAYVGSRTLGPGAEYLRVFQVVGATAVLAWAGALPSNAIWFGKGWGATSRDILDGIVYGLLTAGTFGWLWPR